MVPDRDAPLQSSDIDRLTETTMISRRRALQAGLVPIVSLAGCLNIESSGNPTGGGSNESDNNDDHDEPEENSTDDDADAESESADPEEELLSVVYAFLQAAVEEDIDRMSELSHSHNPLDPAVWTEDGWEFRGGGDEEDLEEIDAEVVNDDATIEDLFDLEGAEFWFEEDALAETLDGENIAAVEVTADDPTEDDMIWMLATEDEEWRYLFAAPIDNTPDNPEELFEEPIEDENDDVVVEIDWEYDNPRSDIPQAAVVLTDERGIDANRIEAKSTIEGASNGAFDRDDDEFTATWEGVTLYVPYDTDGDQIVVTAINEEKGESEIVHREHYEP